MITMNPTLRSFWATQKRYKVLYGGRSSSKTWDAAAQAVKLTSNINLKIMCVRQFQANIKESVYTILVDTIERYGLTHEYSITDRSIKHKITGSEFIFLGLWRNIDEIKSTEAIDVLWIEEGHNLTKEQFEVLDPTIRKQGSEIWLIFNPSNRLAYSWKHFVENKLEDSIKRKINYDENPFLSDTIKRVIDNAKKTLPKEEFEHIYLGYPNESSEDSLFKYKEVMRAMERRVNPLGSKVIGADIGRDGDPSAICRRHGMKVYPILEFKKKGKEMITVLTSNYNAWEADAITIDTIGVGGVVYDIVRYLVPFAIDGNNSFAADDNNRFKNKRAESYWTLAQDVKDGLIDLPDDDILAEELLATEYFINTSGQIQIIEKSKGKNSIRAKIGRSPNRADALALTYFTQVFSSVTEDKGGEYVAPNLF